MQGAEIDAAVADDAANDDVGAVAEDSRTEDIESRTRDRDQCDEAEDDPHRPEHATQPAERALEVLRPLAGDARRVPSAGGAGLGC